MSTEIPETYQAPPLPTTDTSSKFYTNIRAMCDDIEEILSDFYVPNHSVDLPKSPISYVYCDFGMSHAETIMFGIVCKGVENFGDEKFRAGLEAHLIKEIGLAISVPRKDWGRIVSDLANPNSNMWLFHIAIPAEYTSVKLGFIE